MGHFAKVLDGKVVDVITAEPEFFDTLVDSTPGQWLQTSYNTYGNVHKLGGTPVRYNFASIGYNYDKDADAFYRSQPFPSWVLDTSTYLWNPPLDRPTDGKQYKWDEDAYQADNTAGWVLVSSS